jgi:serine/threonine protein kinase
MIGKKTLNYEIKSLIGEGGMGNVYLAEHITIGRKVAIKSLLPQLVRNESIRTRFKGEAKLMADLQHPSIVTLYDYHEDEDGLYLILEYVEGKPLDEYIRDVSGPIPEKEATLLMHDILSGFSYAHNKGLIHRDIKPSNLIISSEQKVKILDFGIAKLVGDVGQKLTKTGTHIGTVYYMSPEQVKGQELDKRSDIYALGVTFYQMLTGVCPYDGMTTEFDVYTKIVTEELPDPRNIYPGISEHLCAIIRKATTKNKEDRFQTCEEFIEAIKTLPSVISSKSTKDVSESSSSQKDVSYYTTNESKSDSQTIPVATKPQNQLFEKKINGFAVISLTITLVGIAIFVYYYNNYLKDSDDDGIPNHIDNCPTEYGSRWDGCQPYSVGEMQIEADTVAPLCDAPEPCDGACDGATYLECEAACDAVCDAASDVGCDAACEVACEVACDAACGD